MQTGTWNEIRIDSTIPQSPIYQQLDKQDEILSVGETHDSFPKKTNDVAYFTGAKINFSDTTYSKQYNCRAYLLTDTLNIDIGFGTGFGGYGFVVSCYNKKFNVRPYLVMDIVDPDTPKPTFEIVYQHLALDKPNYKPGDSLFGKIDFKIMETNHYQSHFQHVAKGFFRAKVKTPWWRST